MIPKAAFLDKDGTLIENVPYNVDPSKIKLTEGAVEGLSLLQEAGYKLIVVSNQSGVALGHFQEEALDAVEDHLRSTLEKEGIHLDGFYYCPHHPDGRLRNYAVPCFCRKPNPGMLFQAAREHHLNLAESWMIGDILNDVEAGRRADCRAILIDNGNETGWFLTPLRHPNFITNDLYEAARLIVDSNRAKNHVGARPFAMRSRTPTYPAQLGI